MATMSSLKNDMQQVKPQTPSQLMNKAISSASMQNLLEQTLHEKKGPFIASIIDLYSNDKTLAECDPGDVIKEALKAVSLDLTINKQMGFVWIIPFKNRKLGKTVPTFQLGYKGYIQLCMRSGIYRTINAGAVYEGEEVTRDRLSGDVKISGDKKSDEAIGYFAYFQTLNGFEKCLYWTRDEVIKHAEKYSKAYQRGSEIWRDNFDEMATKTVLRNLLSHYGLMSVNLVNQLKEDGDYQDSDVGESKTKDTVPIEVKAESAEDTFKLDPDTGEVSDIYAGTTFEDKK